MSWETQSWSEIIILTNSWIYTEYTWTWRTETGSYFEIWYQNNDWTYYLHTENVIQLFLVFIFVVLVLFTFFSLTIKFFNKWRKF
jgi:hypothetical protein